MITRDIAGVFVVPAFDLKTFKSCDGGPSYACGYNPTNSGFNGRIIDRLGLPTQYNSALVVAESLAVFEASSSGQVGSFRQSYLGLSVGLDHNCSTGAGWTAYATGCWSSEHALYLQSTASTENQYLATATDTGNALCTSTGFAIGGVAAAFDLTGAKRYIRVVVAPTIHSSGCALQMPVTASVIFGAPTHAVKAYADVPADAVIVVTSACSTST
jgi:hypothetical protein